MELMWTHWRGEKRGRKEKQREREKEKEEAPKRNVIVAAAAAEACGMYTETNGWGGNAALIDVVNDSPLAALTIMRY